MSPFRYHRLLLTLRDTALLQRQLIDSNIGGIHHILAINTTRTPLVHASTTVYELRKFLGVTAITFFGSDGSHKHKPIRRTGA